MGVLSFIGNAITFAKDAILEKDLLVNDDKPFIKCYKRVEVPPKQNTINDLKQQLESLEKLHNENKIDDTTYKTRKEDLNQQIKELDK